MTPKEAKEYVNKRYDELLEENPTWLRDQISNVILKELRDEHDFVLTLPTGQDIVAVNEDHNGITFQVSQ